MRLHELIFVLLGKCHRAKKAAESEMTPKNADNIGCSDWLDLFNIQSVDGS